MMIDEIKTKEDFIKFILELRDEIEKEKIDIYRRKPVVYNYRTSHFLDGLVAWLEDSNKFDDDEDINWSKAARMFAVGSIYE